MQIGKCEIVLNEFSSTSPVENITPAEALVMHHMHLANGKGRPIKNLVVLPGEAMHEGKPRTKPQEYARLKRRVHGRNGKGVNWVEVVFPSGSNSLPETFQDVKDLTDGSVDFTNAEAVGAPITGGKGSEDNEGGEGDGVPTREQLLKKKKTELEDMAKELKLEVSAGATKEVLADAILAAVQATETPQ